MNQFFTLGGKDSRNIKFSDTEEEEEKNFLLAFKSAQVCPLSNGPLENSSQTNNQTTANK